MGKHVHVIPHTHWDREWYFTTARSKVYLMHDLAAVLDTLENDEEFSTYTLDGQSCLLDDYLAWRPEDAPRIERLVRSGRLLVGPWYTQTDQMVISGESIVRNMYYGMKRAEDFGRSMNVAYVPDSFGQAGNMPQIYRQFGLSDLVTWRGISDDQSSKTDFIWRGDDGSTVLATQMRSSYSVGRQVPDADPASSTYWKTRCIDELGSIAATDNVYMPCGDDQAPIRTDLAKIVRARNEADDENTYEMSSPERYLEAVRAAKPDLKEISGELLCAKHMRIHRSIFSSRSDLKALNTQIQNYLVNVVEPLLTLSHSLGNDYPHGAVEHIWKLLFENAAHDSIGSSVVDEVNQDVHFRYKQARDIAVNLVELHARLIATNVAGARDSHTVTIFNLLPQQRSGVVVKRLYLPGEPFELINAKGERVPYTVIEKRDLTDYVLKQTINLNPSRPIDIPSQVFEATVAIYAEDVPALGYEQYRIVTGVDGQHPWQTVDALENEFYRITVNDDGSLCITDKAAQVTYEREAVLVENGDDGDSFNYSPPRNDLRVFSTDFTPDVRIMGSDVYQRATVSFPMRVPADLGERARGECSAHMPVTLEIGLSSGAKTIDLSVHIDNREPLSHRLCILFDAQMATRVNYADQQFGCIRRDNVHEQQMAVYKTSMGKTAGEPMAWEAGEGVTPAAASSQTQKSWEEPPVSIEPTQTYVALSDGSRSIAVFPQGVREYEIVDANGLEGGTGNLISLTLFRTYGFMGKEDLLYRPGRASGEKTLATPEAQLNKLLSFRVGFATFGTGFNEANIDFAARSYATAWEAYEYASFLNGRLLFSLMEVEGTNPARHSLLSADDGLVVSAVKKAEDRPGIIVRLFNGKHQEARTETLHVNGRITHAALTDLREADIESLEHSGSTVAVGPLGHCQLATVYLEFEPELE